MNRPVTILGIVVCAVSFVVTAFAIHRATEPRLPEPAVPVLTDKLALFRKNANLYDTVVIGSSRVHRAVVPAVVDRSRGDGAVFNFGVPSLNLVRQLWLLEQIAECSPEGLRWVVLEPSLRADFSFDNITTDAVIRFHNWDQTGFAMRYALKGDHGFWGVVAAAEHAVAFGYSAANVGVFPALLLGTNGGDSGFRAPDPSLHGYVPIEDETSAQFANRRERFLRLADRSKARPAPSGPPTGGGLSQHQVDVQRIVFDKIRALGAEPVVFLPPTNGSGSKAYRGAHERFFSDIPLLDLSGDRTPTAFEEFEFWFDSEHLSRRGATLVSQLLGERLAELEEAD